jgi:predicted dehydrogenase
VHVDYVQRPPVHRLEVIGDEGRVQWDFHAGELQWWPVGGELVVRRAAAGFERNTMFLDAMSHFLARVRDRSEPCIPLRDGAEVLRMALEARRSADANASRGDIHD